MRKSSNTIEKDTFIIQIGKSIGIKAINFSMNANFTCHFEGFNQSQATWLSEQSISCMSPKNISNDKMEAVLIIYLISIKITFPIKNKIHIFYIFH